MRTAFIRMMRGFVAATSVPPLLQLYQAIYGLVIRMAVRFFRKYPEIKAIYLRRGCAKGEMLPGVSDIDLEIIVDPMGKEDKNKLRRTYESFARAAILLDPSLGVYDAQMLYKKSQNTRSRYRIMEAKATWKLLYGKDYLADLLELPLAALYGGLYNEIKVWWTIFSWQLLQSRKYHDEPVTRNSLCYKAIGEILKMDLALNHGILTFVRSEALELAKPHLSENDKKFVEKLETLARKRFLSHDRRVLDETARFLLTYLDGFHERFRTHPYACAPMDRSQRVDFFKADWLWCEKERAQIERIVDYLHGAWADTYKGAHLVSGTFFTLDEMVLLVEIDPQRFPTVRELTALHLLHQETEPRLRSRIHLYLLLPHCALQIDVDFFNRGWRSILSPPSNPDLFELLGRPEFAIDGRSYQSARCSPWTPLVEELLRDRKKAFYDSLEDPSIYELNNLEFVRMFWQIVQLVLIHRSVRKEEILYPLTLPAVERALAVERISLPIRLQQLADAYRDELDGKSYDITTLIPEAISYLKEIDGPFDQAAL